MAVSNRNRAAGLLALIVVLLLALTALQYGLIVELSDFQRQQMERTLRVSTDRFVRHLDDEFERLWYVFHVRPGRPAGEEIAQDYAEWVESVDVPGIVAEAFWVSEVSGSAGGVGESAESLEISKIDLASGRVEPTPWPVWLVDLRGPMRESANSHRGRNFHESDSFTASAGEQGMAFVVAQTRLATKSWTVVLLQRDVMIEQFLPSLVREHFGPDDEREYEVRIFDDAQDGRTLFASAPGALPAAGTTPDAVRYLRDFGGSLQSRDGGRSRSLAVAVTHGAGSLDTAVARLRGRNLALSFGVVLVLGASIGVLAVAARRARRLAERQMEFVAGVSHELRTPIAGISSLSQNLADGVVQDLEHAARYGETIHKESRRLANMVEGVLHFSAIRSGRYRYEMKELNAGEVVAAALKTLDPAAVRRSSLTVEVANDLPPLLGDERALQSVVRNLVSNAMKFSGVDGGVRLSVAVDERHEAAEIELRVDDSGAGIEASELLRIFEPFFRGRSARAGQVEGSGLGLSLVKEVVDAHRGRVVVTSEPAKGSTFRVYLPVAKVADACESSSRPVGDTNDAAESRGAPDDRLQAAGSGGDFR